jgi:ribosome-binding protein aMBF1 (putative translation factor)
VALVAEQETPAPLASPSDGVAILRSLAALGHEGVAAAVSEIRQRTGLSHAQLAMRIAVDPSAIAVWEAGHVAPRLHHLFRLVEVLDECERASGRMAASPDRPA